jgi:Uma2 family endonuclease
MRLSGIGKTEEGELMSEATHRPDVELEPTWDIAKLFPGQGQWSEEEYLALDTNHLVEFSDGYLEFLPMPTKSHQLLVLFLYRALESLVSAAKLGTVLVAPYKVQIRPNKYREPDVVFVLKDHESRMGEQFSVGADLVMEVVSDEGRGRDLEIKRDEYARAGIPEYWIVDPQLERITVLWLEGTTYSVHGEFPKGTQATSRLLPGFAVDVTAALTAGR